MRSIPCGIDAYIAWCLSNYEANRARIDESRTELRRLGADRSVSPEDRFAASSEIEQEIHILRMRTDPVGVFRRGLESAQETELLGVLDEMIGGDGGKHPLKRELIRKACDCFFPTGV